MADNFEQLGFQVKVDGADSAVSNLDRIIERLEKIKQLQGKRTKGSQKSINVQQQEEKQTKRNTKALGSYLTKLTSTVVIARKFARVISSAIQESANYVENLNLFAVAYGDVYQETLGWALDLAEGFGLASNEVLRFAGTFRQLSTSLGLVEDTANSVSKTVTQLGYDISALFNTSVENAMEKLQSGLFSGNVRPLRSYGIDISQNQIDALFATNEALSSLGVNARNLSQSDKVLARLIITLRDGSNAFGTMNREINTLQSQIRILQGSFSNFKLAIGDLVQDPLRQSLVYANGFIIALTNIIRLFKPLKTTDENNVFTSTAMGAEEASEAVDELNGKLADFDKFNVLGGQSQGGSQLAITEALTAELEKQQKLYQEQVDAMSKVQNQATLVAQKIFDWLVIIKDGEFVDFTDNAKELATSITVIASSLSALKLSAFITSVSLLGKNLKSTFSIKNLGIMSIVGALAYAYTTNEDFRKSVNNLAKSLYSALLPILNATTGVIDAFAPTIAPIIKGTSEIASDIITLTNNLGLLKPAIYAIIALSLTKRITQFQGSLFSLLGTITGLSKKTLIYSNRNALFDLMYSLNITKKSAIGFGVAFAVSFATLTGVISDLEGSKRTIVSWSSVVFGALASVLGVILAIKGGLKGGLIGASIAGLGVGALVAGIKAQVQANTQGFADGGYTNANLIMTHENGKREWVGKAAGSSAIVNDTQMSEIMEVAVAKGVVLGNRALANQGSDGGGVIHNHIYLDGKQIYEGVTDTAKKYGKKWANA